MLKCSTVLAIFSSVTHFSKCDPFSRMWPIFPNVGHFTKCDPFYRMRPIFPNETPYSKCEPFYKVWPIVIKCTWPIFPSVTHLCVIHFSQAWFFFPSVTGFCKCMAHFSKAFQAIPKSAAAINVFLSRSLKSRWPRWIHESGIWFRQTKNIKSSDVSLNFHCLWNHSFDMTAVSFSLEGWKHDDHDGSKNLPFVSGRSKIYTSAMSTLINRKESLLETSRGLWNHSLDTANQIWLGLSEGSRIWSTEANRTWICCHALVCTTCSSEIRAMDIQRSLWIFFWFGLKRSQFQTPNTVSHGISKDLDLRLKIQSKHRFSDSSMLTVLKWDDTLSVVSDLLLQKAQASDSAQFNMT